MNKQDLSEGRDYNRYTICISTLGTKCHKKECWLTEDFVIAQGGDF